MSDHGKRIAAHLRSWLRGRHTTLPEHMPDAHPSTWNGRRGDCSTGHSASVRPRVTWCSGSSITGRIPNRVTALASDCSTSPSTAAKNAWKQNGWVWLEREIVGSQSSQLRDAQRTSEA